MKLKSPQQALSAGMSNFLEGAGNCTLIIFEENMLKTFTQGTHRTSNPQLTLDRIEEFMPAFGITRVANITGLDRLNVPVCMVCRPNSASLSVSQGKGLTNDAAKVSGIMESIECYHAEYIEIPVNRASCAQISQTKKIVDVDRLSKLAGTSFTKNTEISWVNSWDIINNQNKLVPLECVHINCTDCLHEENNPFISDTNGLASGNSIIEAVNHGLYELIERDALALWSHLPRIERSKRKIILSTIDNAFVQDFLLRVQSAKLDVGIWDITSDVGIPTFVCKLFNTEYYSEGIRPALGSGTHLSKEVAILRAITEAAQSRLTFISGSRDDKYVLQYKNQISLESYEKWHSELALTKENLNYQDLPNYFFQTFEEDQNFIIARLKSIDINEVLCVALTQQKYNIPVVKIVIPGLEGISFAGKRLLGERGKKAYFAARESIHAQ